jgi:predicted HTH transcriptional regulator
MNRILQAYSREVFHFSENFLEVCFEFEEDYLESLRENNSEELRKEFGKNSGKTSGKTSGKILDLMRGDSQITIPEIAQDIGITERSVERSIQKMQREDLIKRIGPAKGGHWEVVE